MLKLIYILILLLTSFSISAKEEYFLTLRNDKVNLRQGPSFEYPIKLFYKKKFLPVIVFEKSENFRKIKDHENNLHDCQIVTLPFFDESKKIPKLVNANLS